MVEISEEDSKRIIAMIEGIVASANFNSRDDPKLFKKNTPVGYYRSLDTIRVTSYLMISYDQPRTITTKGGEFNASEIWIDIHDTQFPCIRGMRPGPFYVVQDGERTTLGRLGPLGLALGLDKVIFPHLPKVIQETLDQQRESIKEY